MMAHDPSLFAGGAALNALDELEADQFQRHLADCLTCQLELSGFAETAARLGAASAETPPASMRSSVLAAVAITRQLPPLTDRLPAQPTVGGTSTPTEPTTASDDAPPTPFPSNGKDADVVDLASRRRLRNRWLLSAAAAVAIALVGVGSFFLIRPAATTEDALLQCVNAASDAEQMPTAPGSTGQTTVTVSASCGAAVMNFADVPALRSDKTYQLWVVSGDQFRSVTTMAPSGDGSISEIVAAVHVGDTALGVTVEPAGGSPQPTTTPVITVPLSA